MRPRRPSYPKHPGRFIRPSRRDGDSKPRRNAQLEQCEPRLTFSAQPLVELSDLAAPPLEQFGVLEGTPDFVLSESLDTALPGLTPLLSEAHEITGVHQVQEMGLDGSGQTVVIIDSGVAWDHASLGAGFGVGEKIVGGWDFAENDADPYDDGPRGFHGTHVTGIIGSEDPIHTGVAPGADIVALRVFNDAGAGMFSWVEDALQWVHDHQDSFEHPITTVNLSLGASWNAETAPSWAMLEEELAQLEADGIFISVAAGNSFAAHGEPGLAYPAASPYVVPVSSVTDAGTLSSFTQRSDRSLLAPGQRIMSTIPDHATTAKDGRVIDFGVASGTSMASPYVAGSAVLVRQAMWNAGVSNVTQDMIYDHLRATADPVYDPVTEATYYRINVLNAVQALSVADDYGDSPNTAHALGAVSASQSVVGEIHSTNDRDYFSFVAASDGRVTVRSSGIPTTWDAPSGANAANAEWSLEVSAGETVVFGVEGTSLGAYSIDIQLEHSHSSAQDLGSVELLTLSNVQVAGEDRYQVTSVRAGILAAAGDGVQVEWWHNGERVAAGAGGAQVIVGADEQWELRLVGNAQVDVTVANQVAVAGNLLSVVGSAGDDQMVWDQDASVLIVNGLEYELQGAYLRLTGGEGADRLEVRGGQWDATIGASNTQLQHLRMGIGAGGFEDILVDAHGGAVSLMGSSRDDALELDATRAVLTSDGYRLEARGFGSVHAIGSGGDDSAKIHDSARNDVVTVYESQTVVRGGYTAQVQGFTTIDVVADQGGADRVYFHDTLGADRFVASPESAKMILSNGVIATADGFERMYAFATGDGDEAVLTDSTGDDRLTAKPERSYLRGEGYSINAAGFSTVEVESVGGEDQATFYDDAGDDRFTAMPGYAVMRGDGFRNTARGFEWVAGFATRGGDDTANLYDGDGDDHLTVSSFGLRLEGDGSIIGARGFETLRGQSLHGGSDTATVSDDWDAAEQVGDKTQLTSEWATGEARGFQLALPLLTQLNTLTDPWSQPVSSVSTLPVVDASGVDQTEEHQRHAAVFSTEPLETVDQLAELLTASESSENREQVFARDELWHCDLDDLVQ